MSAEYGVSHGQDQAPAFDLSFLKDLNTIEDYIKFIDGETDFARLQAFYDAKLTDGLILQKLMRGKNKRFMTVGHAIDHGFNITTNISRGQLRDLKTSLYGEVPIAHGVYQLASKNSPNTMNAIHVRDFEKFVDLARPFIDQNYPGGVSKIRSGQTSDGQAGLRIRAENQLGTPDHLKHGAYGRFYVGYGENPYDDRVLRRDVESRVDDK